MLREATALETCIGIASEITGHDIEVKVNPDFVRENRSQYYGAVEKNLTVS